jgi:hypothetical protein
VLDSTIAKRKLLSFFVSSILIVSLSSIGLPIPPAAHADSRITDFNGDGYADLAIGVPNESIGDHDNAGAVQVLFGTAGGLQANSPNDQMWHQHIPGVRDIAETNDGFGVAVAAGDFNNDGYFDLAIAVASETLGDIPASAVQILYGSSAGLQAISPNDQFWHQDSPGVQGDSETPDLFGYSLAG